MRNKNEEWWKRENMKNDEKDKKTMKHDET